jgi:hypothetical protein
MLIGSQPTPLSPAELRFEEYAACLQSQVTYGEPAATAMASARRAIFACSDQRARMIEETGKLFTREEAESSAARMDRAVPAMILGRPVQIVRRSECASELKDRDQCLR